MLNTRSLLSTISFAFVLTLFFLRGAQAAEPRIALIIDDVCGGTWAQSHRVLDIARKIPVTLSVLPNGESACRARLYRNKISASTMIMLHMPMQPVGHEDPGEGALMIDDSAGEMRRKLDQALTAVPQAKGINNHMGSALTADPSRVKIIADWAAKRHLFYIDSATTPFRACALMRAPCARNNLFLDNKLRYLDIARQLEKARSLSLKSGKIIIVIGHPHPQTMDILESFISKKRVRFVPLPVNSLPAPAKEPG